MTNNRMKGSSTFLVTGGKYKWKLHEAPLHSRMVIIKQKKGQTIGREAAQLKFKYCQYKWTMIQVLWESIWQFPKKLNINFPYNPGI